MKAIMVTNANPNTKVWTKMRMFIWVTDKLLLIMVTNWRERHKVKNKNKKPAKLQDQDQDKEKQKQNLWISKYSLSSLSNLRPAREPLSIIGWQPGFQIFANEPALLKLNGNNSELTRLWAIQRNPRCYKELHSSDHNRGHTLMNYDGLKLS